MVNRRPATVTLTASDEDDLRAILKKAWCRNPEQCVQEFRSNGVTKFLGTDGDDWTSEIVVRKK